MSPQDALTLPRRDPAAATAAAVMARGFYEEQNEAHGRWAAEESAIEFEPADDDRFLAFWVLSEYRDLSQELSMTVADRSTRVVLPGGWSPMSIPVPPGARQAALSVNKLLPAAYHPGDPRNLGVRLRAVQVHRDAERHRQILDRHRNVVANTREMLTKRSRLDTTPPRLGIDLYGACNIKPPCVYCAWDASKVMEGDRVDEPFTLDTLREWGPFFDHSLDLVNCSIGEPFMMKNIEELLDAFADGGKVLNLTTNGQILTDTNIRKLIGRPVDLNVSFDAATPATYATLRNQRFDLLLNNVRRLVAAKGGRGRLPTVNVVFMPMKANVKELDEFVRICADLRVDHLVLRPLNYADKVDLNWERAGYRFEYEQELLPFEALVKTSGRAAELCRQAGVPLSDQMDFGGSLGGQFTEWFEEGRRSAMVEPPSGRTAGGAVSIAEVPGGVEAPVPAEPAPAPGSERLPACTEPWTHLYILRRGVLPCCYGGRPLAPMDQYREVWNSPTLQAIRRDLSRGRFHQYCLESPACPIVRKAQKSDEQVVVGRLRVGARRLAAGLEQQWRRAVWARQWAGIRLRRVLTEPGYARHHARRVWGRLRGGSDASPR
jgi:MoaA/NifB/PqqE/SkfB family radical SAM enzyme